MLYIATDLENKKWLIYLLGEFKRINQADFDITVVDIHQSGPGDVLYFSRSFVRGPAVINKADVMPNGKTSRISDDVFILDGTATTDERFVAPYDLFWNAFVFLSRLEEYLSAQKRQGTNSYSFRHSRLNKETFNVPVVNNFFDQLEAVIKTYFPHCSFGKGGQPVVELSHDVDYIEKTLQLRLRRSGTLFIRGVKNIYRPGVFFECLWGGLKHLAVDASYWCFDYWRELERGLDKRSVFYVYAKTSYKNSLKAWLINPSYDITKDVKLQTALRQLMEEGFEVGLHGSYQSAADVTELRQEKRALEAVLGRTVNKTRQHWLRYEEDVTPYAHAELFDYDSTLGWNDRMGFRSGCASRYRPYDHRAQQGFDFFETPQIIMDGNIFNLENGRVDAAIKKSFSLLSVLRRYKNACVSISWHQRACSADYGWHKLYEELIGAVS